MPELNQDVCVPAIKAENAIVQTAKIQPRICNGIRLSQWATSNCWNEKLGKRHRRTLVTVPLQFSSVQFRHSVVSDSLGPRGPQHARPPCPSPAPAEWGAISFLCTGEPRGLAEPTILSDTSLGLCFWQSPVRGRSLLSGAGKWHPVTDRGGTLETSPGPCTSSAVVPPPLFPPPPFFPPPVSPCSWLPSLSHPLPISFLLLPLLQISFIPYTFLKHLLCAWASLSTEDAVSK